jgi:hypothetical protein
VFPKIALQVRPDSPPSAYFGAPSQYPGRHVIVPRAHKIRLGAHGADVFDNRRTLSGAQVLGNRMNMLAPADHGVGRTQLSVIRVKHDNQA